MLRSLNRVLSGRQTVFVPENERALVLIDGRFYDFLGAGEHQVPKGVLAVERHALGQMVFASQFDRALFGERPDLVEANLTIVQAEEGEIVVAFRDGFPVAVSTTPKQRHVFLTAAGPFEVRLYPVSADNAVPEDLRGLAEAGVLPATCVTQAVVDRGYVGLLSIAGRPMGMVREGVHYFVKNGRPVGVKLVDTRTRTHEVTGQEVLTADRVTVRVNIAAAYRVVDPERAVSAVKDFSETLHLALQLAFRRTVGRRTLDTLLAEKVVVDSEAAERVRTEMAEIGVEVGEIALKDVILPGEMREILNQVVTAEKQAEANIIRRREETQATRALLNTAKVMAENPVMLRLKELEALTELAGKVERLTVHNGTEGLLNDLVRLREA